MGVGGKGVSAARGEGVPATSRVQVTVSRTIPAESQT